MSVRLEDLINALLNGEQVDFEPQSRFESYLKACANGTLADLPTPTCRADILLYQLALKMASGDSGGSSIPVYSGSYTVDPSTVDQILSTAGKTLTSNVTVKAMPTYGGSYTVSPSSSEQTLQTAGKYMTSNLKVEAMPEVSGGGGFPNGTEWTPCSAPSPIAKPVYGNGVWVATGGPDSNTYPLLYSDNGQDWIPCGPSVTPGEDYTITGRVDAILYADGIWLALCTRCEVYDSDSDGTPDYGENYTVVCRSLDGMTWEESYWGGYQSAIPLLYYKDGCWVLFDPGYSDKLRSSVDGVTWIESGSFYPPSEIQPDYLLIRNFYEANGLILADMPWYYGSSYCGDTLFASVDGKTWYTAYHQSARATFHSIVYYRGMYLLSWTNEDDQKSYVSYAYDYASNFSYGFTSYPYLINGWMDVEVSDASNIVPIRGNYRETAQTCLLCGPNKSSDGKTWSTWACTNGVAVTKVYDGINFKGKTLVAATDKGIVYSTDGGITWVQSSICKVDCTKLLESNGVLIAIASNGIFYSYDGATWTATNVTDSTTDIEYANGVLVANSHYSVVWEPS